MLHSVFSVGFRPQLNLKLSNFLCQLNVCEKCKRNSAVCVFIFYTKTRIATSKELPKKIREQITVSQITRKKGRETKAKDLNVPADKIGSKVWKFEGIVAIGSCQQQTSASRAAGRQRHSSHCRRPTARLGGCSQSGFSFHHKAHIKL